MATVTVNKILQHRKARADAKMIGCISGGDDRPLTSLSGISWRPADPKKPHCFCHECRSTWDKTGEIDAELVNEGHEMACYVYASLLDSTAPLAQLQKQSDAGGGRCLVPPGWGGEDK
jgi:hypothetical protein